MIQEKSTVRRLKRLPLLFRKADAEKIAPHTAQFLSRASAAGLILRISRGIYANVFLLGLPGVEEVACFLRPPAYISCEWAMNFHGITLQTPFVCTVVTLSGAVGKKRSVLYQGVAIEFSSIAERLFRGFETREGFQMATPEKAVLDTLHLHKRLPAEDELEWGGVDMTSLMEQAKAYPGMVAGRLETAFHKLGVVD